MNADKLRWTGKPPALSIHSAALLFPAANVSVVSLTVFIHSRSTKVTSPPLTRTIDCRGGHRTKAVKLRNVAKTITKGIICFLTSTISREELVIDSGIIVAYRVADFETKANSRASTVPPHTRQLVAGSKVTEPFVLLPIAEVSPPLREPRELDQRMSAESLCACRARVPG